MDVSGRRESYRQTLGRKRKGAPRRARLLRLMCLYSANRCRFAVQM